VININEKLNYNEIAKTKGVEESRRLWRLNNIDNSKKEENFDGLICPCCEMYHFKNQDFYEFCPICHWQDDPVQRRAHDYIGGANKLSLNQYRIQWKEAQLLQEISQVEENSQLSLEVINLLDKIKIHLSTN